MTEHDITVVLDLDNTLIYSSDIHRNSKQNARLMKLFKTVRMNDDYIVFFRPGLEKFLDWLFDNFNVIIWSAGSESYVEFIVENIVENKYRNINYVLHAKHCEVSQKLYGEDNIKKLELLYEEYDLPFSSYNVILIDDLKRNIKTNPDNSIHIKKFIAKDETVNDNELKEIKKKLTKIKRNYIKNINKNANFKLLQEY